MLCTPDTEGTYVGTLVVLYARMYARSGIPVLSCCARLEEATTVPAPASYLPRCLDLGHVQCRPGVSRILTHLPSSSSSHHHACMRLLATPQLLSNSDFCEFGLLFSNLPTWLYLMLPQAPIIRNNTCLGYQITPSESVAAGEKTKHRRWPITQLPSRFFLQNYYLCYAPAKREMKPGRHDK